MEKGEKASLIGMITGIGLIVGGYWYNSNLAVWGLIVLFVSLFGFLIWAFYHYVGDDAGKGFTKDEIRRSITFTFVIMYIVFLCLSLAPSKNAILNFEASNEFINNFHNAILVILAFYFGSRAFEVGMGARTKIRDWAKNIFSKKFEIEGTEKGIKELKGDMIEKVKTVDVDAKKPEDVTAEDLDKVKKLKEVLIEIIRSE